MGGQRAARPFVFRHVWRLAAAPSQVYAVLADPEGYPQWWPSVRAVRRVDDASGWATVRSLAPIPLRLLITREVQDESAGRLRVRLDGDLAGFAEFRVRRGAQGLLLSQDGSQWAPGRVGPAGSVTVADYVQEVIVTPSASRLLRLGVALAPGALRANHRVMMTAGEWGLRRALAAGGDRGR